MYFGPPCNRLDCSNLTPSVGRHIIDTMRAILHLVVALCLLAVPVRATWSILIVDTKTGEIAIGIATCLAGFDLRPDTVVVIPGVGRSVFHP